MKHKKRDYLAQQTRSQQVFFSCPYKITLKSNVYNTSHFESRIE